MVYTLVMRLAFPPPSSLINAMSVIGAVALANIGLSEIRGKHLQYSKFWNFKSTKNQIQVSSRIGMLVAYTPAFLAAVASLVFFPTDENLRVLLLKAALTVHFFKRIFEVLFIHKYSSGMVLDTMIPISLSYFTSTASMIYAQHLTATQGFPEPPIDLKYAGIVLFPIGITGNFYHHYLLSKLRNEKEKEYKVPKGGLFDLAICPHYLFEILGFWGISFIAQTLHAFSFAVGTTLYLMGRSYATRRWYLAKFEDFSQDVKALIPFVF